MFAFRSIVTRSVRFACEATSSKPTQLLQVKPAREYLDSIYDSGVDDLGNLDNLQVLLMDNPPANLLNLVFVQQFKQQLIDIAESRPRGLLLASAKSGIFCAGLDLRLLYPADRAVITEFWKALHDLWLVFYSLPLPVVAGINGHAIAGGCMLSLCADRRVIGESCQFGMNEPAFGLPVPNLMFSKPFEALSGFETASKLLPQGILVKGTEAVELKLAHEAVPLELVPACAVRHLSALCDGVVPGIAAQTKLSLRSRLLEEFAAKRDADLEHVVSTILDPAAQATIGAHAAALASKSAASSKGN